MQRLINALLLLHVIAHHRVVYVDKVQVNVLLAHEAVDPELNLSRHCDRRIAACPDLNHSHQSHEEGLRSYKR